MHSPFKGMWTASITTKKHFGYVLHTCAQVYFTQEERMSMVQPLTLTMVCNVFCDWVPPKCSSIGWVERQMLNLQKIYFTTTSTNTNVEKIKRYIFQQSAQIAGKLQSKWHWSLLLSLRVGGYETMNSEFRFHPDFSHLSPFSSPGADNVQPWGRIRF